MNKSQEFIINLIKNGRCSEDFIVEDFQESSIIYPSIELMPKNMAAAITKDSVKVVMHGKNLYGITGEANIIIKYDPNAEFDYFTSDICVHDGSLIFLQEAIANIFNKIIKFETHYAGDVPDEWGKYLWDYDYEYTIGDFVIVNKFGDEYATGDKSWLKNKQIVTLPIKWRYIKKEK